MLDYIVIQSIQLNIYQSTFVSFTQIWYLGIVLSDAKIAKNITIWILKETGTKKNMTLKKYDIFISD